MQIRSCPPPLHARLPARSTSALLFESVLTCGNWILHQTPLAWGAPDKASQATELSTHTGGYFPETPTDKIKVNESHLFENFELCFEVVKHIAL